MKRKREEKNSGFNKIKKTNSKKDLQKAGNKNSNKKIENDTSRGQSNEQLEPEILHTEEKGYLETEGMEKSWKISQKQLLPLLDKQSVRKVFDLTLDIGPFGVDYSRNGNYLLLTGTRGHVSLVDWKGKKLETELFLNETCHDSTFLHDYSFFAVAQKKMVYIYDSQGTEIHQLQKHTDPYRLQFLPYHYLLASIGERGILRYQDTSTGSLIAELKSKLGPCHVMEQNPSNAILCLGHSKGLLTMWSPNIQKPLVKLLCHQGSITSLKVDQTGTYLITSGLDSHMKIWDIRTYNCLFDYESFKPIRSMDLSQRSLLGTVNNSTVQIWKDVFLEKQESPYMQHTLESQSSHSIKFCPYEDLIGIGHTGGFSSIVVPGSGEPNFDSYAANPFQSSGQRKEAEVHSLLDKIQPEMITLNPRIIGNIATSNEDSKEVEITTKKKEKKKMRGKNSASKRYKKKQENVVRESKKYEKKLKKSASTSLANENYSALSRFDK